MGSTNTHGLSLQVREEMAQYTLGQGFSHWEFMFICGWPSPFGGGDASSVLRVSKKISGFIEMYTLKEANLNIRISCIPVA